MSLSTNPFQGSTLLCGTQGALTSAHILDLVYIPLPYTLRSLSHSVLRTFMFCQSLGPCDATVPSPQNSILLIHPAKIQNKCYLLLKASPIFPKAIPSLSSNKLFTSCCRGLCAYLPSLCPIAQIAENKNFALFLSMVPSPHCLAESLAPILVHNKYLDNRKIEPSGWTQEPFLWGETLQSRRPVAGQGHKQKL